MIKWFFRCIFLLVGASVGYKFGDTLGNPFYGILFGIIISVAAIIFEWFISSKPISVISSVVFGAVLGLLLTAIGSEALKLVIGPIDEQISQSISTAMLVGFTYLGIAILYQTRDKFNVIIPYVEFRREEKGVKPLVLDTSSLVDGRIADVLKTGIIYDPVIVPEMVLEELHNIADSDEKTRRERGRLGMQMLDILRKDSNIEFSIQNLDSDPHKPVDQRLVDVAKTIHARIMTNDYNLNRVASIGGIDVINLNELSNALRPTALPEEQIKIKLVRSGEQRGQAVGYLDDGTMVVVEDGIKMLGKEVMVKVTNTITRDSGRIVFADIVPQRSRKSY